MVKDTYRGYLCCHKLDDEDSAGGKDRVEIQVSDTADPTSKVQVHSKHLSHLSQLERLEKGIQFLKRAANCTASQDRWDKMRHLRDIDLAQGVKYNTTCSMNEIDVAIETHRQILQLLSDEDEDIDKMTARADFDFTLKARLRHRDTELPSDVQGSAEDLRDADEMAKKESSLARFRRNIWQRCV